jgi:hypothetical protein
MGGIAETSSHAPSQKEARQPKNGQAQQGDAQRDWNEHGALSNQEPLLRRGPVLGRCVRPNMKFVRRT